MGSHTESPLPASLHTLRLEAFDQYLIFPLPVPRLVKGRRFTAVEAGPLLQICTTTEIEHGPTPQRRDSDRSGGDVPTVCAAFASVRRRCPISGIGLVGDLSGISTLKRKGFVMWFRGSRSATAAWSCCIWPVSCCRPGSPP